MKTVSDKLSSKKNSWRTNSILKNYDLYIMLLLPFSIIVVFSYIPMYGILIAFKDYVPSLGIVGSEWCGLDYFKMFFKSRYAALLIKNTLGISFYSLAVSFPLPIILALMLNEVKNTKFKSTVQTITYAPYFISTVVMCGMIIIFLTPEMGIINVIIKLCGGKSISFLQRPEFFKTIYVLTGAWQTTGWSSILYIAVLTNVDEEIKEAATIDGANIMQKIIHINIPCLVPTMIIMLIMSLGGIMNVGFEKIYLLQNGLNMDTSDVISTYVYRAGLVDARYGFSTAVGLFNSLVNFILLVSVNYFSKAISDTSLW